MMKNLVRDAILYLGRYGGRMRRAVGRTAGEVTEEITKG